MDLNEKTIDRTVIYNGKIVDVEIHTVTLPNSGSMRQNSLS